MMPKQAIRALLRTCAIVGVTVVATALVLVFTTAVVFAQPWMMLAPEAHTAVLNDDLIILDIRSPAEWDETGVAQGSWPVTMHDPDFGVNLQRIVARFPNRPIALICATGGRSNYVAKVLADNGLSDVIDVSEGMFGNGRAPGWIARQLPIVDVASARSDLSASLLVTD